MKKLIRTGVFETNSSSSHSISLGKDDLPFVYSPMLPDREGKIYLYSDHFGWEWSKYNDALTKATYVAIAYKNNDSMLESLVDLIKQTTGCYDVIIDVEDGYIDHQSYETAPSDIDDIKNFIFNSNSWLFTGNDNSYPPSMFYDVPVYNADGTVTIKLPQYRLNVVGIDKIIEFIEKPTDEELGNILYELLNEYCLDETGKLIFIGYYTLRPAYVFSSGYLLPITYNDKLVFYKKQEVFKEIENIKGTSKDHLDYILTNHPNLVKFVDFSIEEINRNV